MTHRRLYILALLLGFAGQLWILYSYHKLEQKEEAFHTCIFKAVTGLPCPSCGTVHSIVSILHGDFRKALEQNPLGFAGILMTALIPYWVLADLALGRESFYRFFKGFENLLKNKWLLFGFLFCVFLIWVYKLGSFFHLF